MKNGDWRMKTVEWRLENEDCRMENGEWRMGNGEWRMEEGQLGLLGLLGFYLRAFPRNPVIVSPTRKCPVVPLSI
jgi:hypothetical protein